MQMTWLMLFIAGMAGSYLFRLWGVADKPIPGVNGPWSDLVAGVLGGVAAIYAAQLAGISDPMPGMVLGIATGMALRGVLGSIFGSAKAA